MIIETPPTGIGCKFVKMTFTYDCLSQFEIRMNRAANVYSLLPQLTADLHKARRRPTSLQMRLPQKVNFLILILVFFLLHSWTGQEEDTLVNLLILSSTT